NMPGESGLDLVHYARKAFPDMVVIMVTGVDEPRTIDSAVEAGVYSYMLKPFESRQMLLQVKNALKHQQADVANRRYQEDLEQELAEKIRDIKGSEEKFRAISSSAHDAIIMINDEGKIAFWNEAAERIFGYASEEVIGENLHHLVVPVQYRSLHDKAFPGFRASGRGAAVGKTLELEAIRKGGETFPVEVSLSAAKIEGKWHAIGIVRDITERKLLERQLTQAQKLESIGQLAAGIAHEINTPTQYVGDNTRFLKEGFEDLDRLVAKYQELALVCKEGRGIEEALKQIEETADEIIPAAIEQSLEGVDRVTKIVRAMKEFSHPGGEEKTPTDINKAIENTVTVARNEWKYVADLKTDFDENLPPVPCLPGELNQVILNMIVNAAHAIAGVVGGNRSGEKGTITIRTRKNGAWAEIEIEDTGAGIPEEIQQRIFDPFFTTKEVGRGTGQGLCIAHSVIVEKHGGTIDVESEVGKGTTFMIRLPLED
ncbi:MAG: PAS domain S-box protein, partial [Deltaproteobacteria bacterium]|nr:PAS domain S-box protein [Deltaproteobacteria bacterium]